MQKYYCREATLESIAVLSEEESRHCISVMRNGIGAQIGILNGLGSLFLGEIIAAHPKKTSVKIIKTIQESDKPLALHIAISPTKNNDRIEFFIEKACEIGVGQITPILFERTERKKINIDRWIKIAHAACKQSGQLFFPTINEPTSFESFLKQLNPLHTAMTIIGEKKTMQESHKINTIVIGPEGDFSPKELALISPYNFHNISLGDTILRVETAGLVAVSQWNFIYN